MKLNSELQKMLVRQLFYALAKSVSADEGKKEKKVTPSTYAMVPAYLIVAILMFVFIVWASWRVVRNWGSWKIHTPSPRPHYVRTLHGWVDRGTWELKQAKRTKRQEAKRDQHRLYRTTKANHKWIFHDPTGELQQRFDDQKKRSYLRLLPSWMRSYPHGTLQLGISAKLDKAQRGTYPVSDFQSPTHSRLTLSEPLENAQLDGCGIAHAFGDHYRLPDLPIMDYLCEILPGAPAKPGTLPKVPRVDQPIVTSVWHVRLTMLPELGRPRFESEQELDGQVEPQESVIERVTQNSLEIGRHRQELNDLDEPLIDSGSPHLPSFTVTLAHRPPVFGRRPVQAPPLPDNLQRATRLQNDDEGPERLTHDLRTEITLTSIRGDVDSLLDEIRTVVDRIRVRANALPFNSTLPELTRVHASLASARRINRGQFGTLNSVVPSTPTIITPPMQEEPNRAVIENLGTDDATTIDSTSEEEIDEGSDRAVTERLVTDGTSSPDHISEANNQNPITAALLRSVSDHDASLDPADRAAQRPSESEDAVRAEAIRQTAAFYNEMGHSGTSPNVPVHYSQADNDAAPVTTRSSPTQTATTGQVPVTATPSLQDLDGASDEALYTNEY